MKHILCPTDFSLDAQNAFLYAAHVANRLNAVITLLHVRQDPPHLIKAPFSEEVPEWVEAGNYEACFKLMQNTLPPGIPQPVRVDTLINSGSTVAGILEVANAQQPDLIIMGTTGASGIKEIFIGSNTSNLIENSDITILAIPESATFHDFKYIAMPNDFLWIKEDALRKVLDFASAFDAEVHCFHVNVAHNPLLTSKAEKWAEKFSGEKIVFEIVEGDYIPEGINRFIEEKQADLLAMITHKYTFFDRLFQTSYTEKLALHTDTPLLAVK
jgi:nucleotide-binding universal stress UspA family protein